MDIAQFKEQNPAYKDVPDVTLADALHAKYYSDMPRDQFMQQAGLAGPGGNLSMSMKRDDYAKQFMADNPQADQKALDMALGQYDQAASKRTEAGGNAVQDRFKQLQSPEAMFDARLNAKLQGDRDGVVPALPDRQQPDNVNPAPPAPSTFDTVAGNLTGGALSTLTGALASGAHLVGADDYGNEIDQAKAAIAQRQKELGGDSFTGKVSGLVGGIIPAMAAPEGMLEQAISNAGLFAIPAFQDKLKEKLAAGESRAAALTHAAEAFGINMVAPTVMQHGMGAVIGKAAEGASGLGAAALGLGQAAGEGVGFSALNSVSDKATDAAFGYKNDRPWLDPEDMAVQATGFGLLRGAHMVPGAVDAVAQRIAQAKLDQARGAIMDQLAAAPTVDDAIAAAQAAVALPVKPSGDDVASLLQAIRPLEQPEPAAPALGDTATSGTPTELGARYVRMTNPDGSTGFALASDPTQGGMLDAALPEAGNVGPAGGGAAARDGLADATRPAATGLLPGREAAPDARAVEENPVDRVAQGSGADSQPALSRGDGWYDFPPETGTLGIPRADMPQIRAEVRGPLVNFLNARGIAHEQVEVPADRLRPTQAEFSLDKMQQAQDYKGGERSILVSGDGHVLDGHHQWLAALEHDKPVKAIVLDAPIRELIDQVREFPSATVADGAPESASEHQNAPQNIPENIPAIDQHAGQRFADEGAARQYLTENRIGDTHTVKQTGRAQFDIVPKVQQAADWRAATAMREARLAAEIERAKQNSAAAQKAGGGQRARERLQENNPFLAFLANHGVSLKDKADSGMENGRAGNPMVPGYGPLFRRTGLRLDELALLAKDAGFLTGHDIEHAGDTGGTRKLADMIRRSVQDKEAIQTAGAIERGLPGADQRLLDEARTLGIETAGKSADTVYDEVVAAHAAQEARREQTGAESVHEQADIERFADAFTPDDARVAEMLARDADIPLDGGEPSHDLTDGEIDAIFGIRTTEQEKSTGRETEGHPAEPAAQGAEGTGAAREGDQDLLSGYSRGDIVARQEAVRADAQQKAAEDARAAAEQRAERDRKDVAARIDDSAEHFQLGQSAHDSVAGQNSLFGPDTMAQRRVDPWPKEIGEKFLSLADHRGMARAPELADWLESRNDPDADALADWLRHMGDADVSEASVAMFMASRGHSMFSKMPVFYSALARTVPDMAKIAAKDGTVKPEQARLWLASRQKEGKFKADELQWSGVDDWLKTQQGRVAVADVANFIEHNGVQVQEVMKGARDPVEALNSMSDDELRQQYVETYGGEVSDPEVQAMPRDELIEAVTPDDRAEAGYSATPDGTKYSQYVLAGGENYRELLLTLPERSTAKMVDGQISFNPDNYHQDNYQSAHWDEKNIVAHVRFNDRTDADGKRVLFIEELQSDWGQDGLKKGFRAQKERQLENLIELRDAATDDVERDRLQGEISKLAGGDVGVAEGPFVGDTKSWLSLGIKRMIRYAAENGYDRIAFVNGEQSADRYDLSKQVDSIHVVGRTDASTGERTRSVSIDLSNFGGNIRLGLDAKGVVDSHSAGAGDFIGKNIADIVGKEVGERIMSADVKTPGGVKFEGDGLKVGGTGMREFYDRIVPQTVNEVLKKVGGDKATIGELHTPVPGFAASYRYAGPEHSLDQIKDALEVARKGGGDIMDNPLTGERTMFAFNRTANETSLRKLVRLMEDGQPFHEAVLHDDLASPAFAELMGGHYEELPPEQRRMDVNQQVGFDITPQLRAKALDGLPLFSRAVDPGRRQALAALAAAVVSPELPAGVALGKARALDAAVLSEHVTPVVEKILRGGAPSGETNENGAQALRSAMHAIALTGPKELRPLAAQLESLLPKDGRVLVTVDDTARVNLQGAVELAPDVHLRLFTAEGRTGLTYETLLHETAHVAVAARYRSLSAAMAHGEDLHAARAMEQFKSVWQEFRQAVAGDTFPSRELEMSVGEARANPDEFFVRTLTDPLLQDYMAKKAYQGTTLWQRFKDWVQTRLFGMKRGTAPSWLDAALTASGELSNAMQGDAADFSRVQRPGVERGTAFTARSRVQEDSPEFKRWFGDSKIVDSKGNPLVLYHGTTSADKIRESGFKKGWVHLTDSRPVADSYHAWDRGGNPETFAVYAKAENPAYYDAGGAKYTDIGNKIFRATWDAERAGHDAMVITNVRDNFDSSVPTEPHTTVVVFRPDQIKSATDNRGTFDPDNPDIMAKRRVPDEPDENGAGEEPDPDSLRRKLARLISVPKSVFQSAVFHTRMLVAPMEAGDVKAMAMAKDFANHNRRAQQQWAQFDKVLRSRYTEEQQRKMWIAADQENDLRRAGRTSDKEGLATLTDGERKTVELLHEYGQQLWKKANDCGLVSSDGVAFWTPRVAANIVEDGSAEAIRQPASEFSKDAKNLRTSASSTKHRSYETTAESEAALKTKLGDSAAYVKNIRVMPMAMMHLEKAIAGRTLVNQVKAHGKVAGEDLVRDDSAPGFVTFDHPALKQWRPRMDWQAVDAGTIAQRGYEVKGDGVYKDGDKLASYRVRDGQVEKLGPMLDSDGKPVMEAYPLFVRKDFAGPLKAVFSQEQGAIYRGLMNIKGGVTSMIMISPLTHNLVIWGKAMPTMISTMGWKNNLKNFGTLGLHGYFVGNTARADHALMSELVEAGLVPVSGRGMTQDAVAIHNGIQPGRSMTAKFLGRMTGLVEPVSGPIASAAGKAVDFATGPAGRAVEAVGNMVGDNIIGRNVAGLGSAIGKTGKFVENMGTDEGVRKNVDAVGQFWHEKLLWDRVADLQAGMAVMLRASLMDKGLDQYTANRMAVHFANRYAGMIPHEAMSDAANKLLNLTLFSKSFTMTNLGAYKDLIGGMPKDVRAQIATRAREIQLALGRTDAEADKAADQQLAKVQKIARGKAASILVLDIAAMATVTSLAQSLWQGQSGQQIVDDFKERLKKLGHNIAEDPLSLIAHPIDALSSLSQTSDNPHGKEDRVRLGEDEKGNTYYARLPVGKVGEELKQYSNIATGLHLLHNKMSTFLRPLADLTANEDFTGKRIINPNDNIVKQVAAFGAYWVKSQLPVEDAAALYHLGKGDADEMDKLKLLGTATGLSVGRLSGGDAVAEMRYLDREHQAEYRDVLPDVREALRRDDVQKAQDLLESIGQTPREIQRTIQQIDNPDSISRSRMRRFNQHATDDERERLDKMRQSR